MTPAEYIQLKAFARIDGLWLSLMWMASFACYVAGISMPLLSAVALVLIASTPFFVGRRLRLFRDYGLEGSISFLRAWGYVIMMFFYGALLFAAAQYVYFKFLDQGYLLAMFSKMMSRPENVEMLKQMGMTDTVNESLSLLSSMRPIDLVLNMLTTNIMIGMVVGIPIAALLQKKKKAI